MKAQLSLEFLIYLSVAGASLAVVVAAVPSLLGRAYAYASEYAALSFVDKVNAALISGNATIAAYLPAGLCNATAHGSALETRWGTLYFIVPVFVGNALCPSGTNAEFEISAVNGTALLRRIS
ncbi:MAG: hypothetical protein QXT43_02680 [Candidatus Micrarchaeaceae archaeon]